ncbi:hypothetical protein Nepgr_008322 [Nepenthes gracilis]|uniref:Protein CROWDED NUCLEI 4-like n=1 Tax=Nepenthes gracilis TaxID=150966 RepID=A0AAD3S9A7_NEPGR|nr:hypothetical protein Nepgr_008322 [Nepenthes gracilis]
MASPQSDRLTATPASGRLLCPTLGSRVRDTFTLSTISRSPLTGEAMWKRLRDAGFDEESIRRRDKAALIAYIAKLESEIHDLQQNVGLLTLERKDWASKYEQAKLSAESAEIVHKCERAALFSDLAEARTQEENLRKALGIEKECVANIEKALREMRAECAEVKVTAESKMAEACSTIENAQNMYTEAEAKLHLAESLQAEASRYHGAAERELREVEAREDDLRRRALSFKTDCDAKEREIMLDRQSLSERWKTLNQLEDKLLDGQALLSQRESDVLYKSQELNRLEKDLEALKGNIDTECGALMLERSNLKVDMVSLSEREKAVVKKEALLNKKDQELLISQEKLASKEHDNVQKLIAEQENSLKTRIAEFDAGLEMKRKLVEEEIEAKRRAWELRELDLKQQEDFILERELELEVQYKAMADKGKDMTMRMSLIEEKENILDKTEKEVELKKVLLQKEMEEIGLLKVDQQKSLCSLEEKRKQIINAETNLEVMKSETSQLIVLETKLKEEVDIVRAQKWELDAEADKMKVEKAKFETEWELIDDKREELRREEERIAGERLAISKFLKDERDFLNLERAAMRDQYKQDLKSLSHDREAFLSEIQHERSEWFTHIQQERSDFLLDIEMRKRELEDHVNKRHEEIESYLSEKERVFEEEKKKELQHISSLREAVMKEQELVTLEMRRLQVERSKINLDHERRDKEWKELNSLIEELKMQRQKLKEQRELMHAERKEMHSQIEYLKILENSKIPSDEIVVPEIQQSCPRFNGQELFMERFSECQTREEVPNFNSDGKTDFDEDGGALNVCGYCGPENSSSSSAFSWFKRWIYKHLPDGPSSEHDEKSLLSESREEKLWLVGKRCSEKITKIGSDNGLDATENVDSPNIAALFGSSSGEPKVIHEVHSVGADVEVVHDLESSCQMDVRENSIHEFPRPGRKRRIEKTSELASDIDTLLTEQKQNNKRRRQADDTPPKPSGDVTSHCLELKQPNTMEGQHAIISSNKIQSFENTEILQDKVIGTSELTPEVTDIDECHSRVHPNLGHDLEVDTKEDVRQDGGSYEQDGSAQVEHSVLTFSIEEQIVIEDVLVVDGKEVIALTEAPSAGEPKELEHSNAPDTRSGMGKKGDEEMH